MPEFANTPIPYVPIADKATEVRAAIDAARLSAANSFGGLQKLAIPGPFATDAEANTFGVPDDNLYYRSDGTVRAASHISLDLAFALDKTLTARTGPTPTFSRASSGLFVNANGILVGKTEGTTLSLDPTSTTVGTTEVTVTVASGSVVGWLVGQSVSLIVDSNANNAPDTGELWLVGDIVSTTATQLVFRVTSKGSTSASATAWTLGYRGARFDHDPATGASKGLLIEESRTNLITRSEEFNDAVWTPARASVSATQVASPTGTITADKIIVDTSASNNHRIDRASVTLTTNTVYTFSVFVKASEYSGFAIGVNPVAPVIGVQFDLTGSGSVTLQAAGYVGTIQDVGNGWFRCRATFTSDVLATSHRIYIYVGQNGTTFTYTGDGTSGIFLWGAQLEAGAFPTSYIPTTSGTAARSADVCSIIGDDFSSFYSQSEGSMFAEVSYINTSKAAWIISAYAGSLSAPTNYISLLKNSSGVHRQTIVTNSAPQGNLDISGAVAGVQYKYAGGYKTNDAAFTVGGVTPVSDLTVTLPSTNALSIGSTFSEYTNGHIARIQYFRKRLSNAKLQTLTAP